MKYLIFVAVTLLVTVYAEDKYSTENDDLDIESVVADVKTLKEFVDCFTDRGQCNDVSADFKKDTAEAIQTACLKCTDAQKHIFKVFLAGLKEKLPADYAVYKQKYDPEDKYFIAIETAVANS